jgi:hypothetical protein
MVRYHDEQWLREKYHGEGLTAEEMGDMCGVSPAAIYKWMDRNNIERRPKDQCQRNEYAGFATQQSGYETWRSHNSDGTEDRVRVHRLLAVAKYGFEAVGGMHVHHKNGIKWDNRIENVEIFTPTEHRAAHDEYVGAPWRDKQKLVDAYTRGSMEDIAEWWDCDPTTILRWMDHFGIERRSVREAQEFRGEKPGSESDE